jgi:hypothetical protein
MSEILSIQYYLKVTNQRNKIATNSKNKNIRDLYRGINKFQKGYQPTSNLIKDGNGDLLADSHNILNSWKNYFSQLLNVHRVSNVRQIEIHTAEPIVPEPSPFEVKVAISELKTYKSPGSDQIPAELIQAGGETLQFEIHRFINCIWSKEELPDQRKESIIVPIYKKGDKTDCSNYRGISLLSTSYKIVYNILLSRLSPYVDEIIRNHQCGFRCNRSTTNQIFLHSLDTGEKMGVQCNSTSVIHKLQESV